MGAATLFPLVAASLGTGSARELQADGVWQYVGPGAAWELTTAQPAVAAPPWYTAEERPYGNRLVRLDLASGRK